jgi:C-terminal processing protease CtpA/Prc
MRARLAVGVVLLFVLPHAASAARVDHTPALGFESVNGAPPLAPWTGQPRGPEGTLFLDSVSVHSGRYSGRLERTDSSATQFSSFAYPLPRDFDGNTLELRGWLKLENVKGTAGLWQRQDGAVGVEQFDNMAQRNLHGTVDWTEYRIPLPLSSGTRRVTVGSLLSGTGRVWADDLQLFVDGKPVLEAPEYVPPKTVLETDTSFVAGSGITLEKPTAVQIENLVLLGKVWGFLKYHHPEVVRGNRHWDFDLFRVAPRVMSAKDRGSAQRELVRWIDSLGPVRPCSSCVKAPVAPVLAPRIGWIGDRAIVGKDLAKRLAAIHAARPDTAAQFFVSQIRMVGNPDFTRELGYVTKQTDAGYRLLALYRVWNIVEYWFPYRDVIDHDWDATLREFVPRMLGANTYDAYRRETMALVAHIQDTHANLWGALAIRPPLGTALLPVSVRFLAKRAVVFGYTNPRLGPATGLRVGDVVESIAGTPVDSLVERWRPMYAGSNDAAQRRDMARELTRGEPGPVELAVDRDGTKLSLSPVRVVADSLDRSREVVHDQPGPTFRRLSDDIAYLKLSSVKAAEVPRYLEGMAGAKCVLIDIRNYPSEFMVFALGQHLVKEPTPFVKFTIGDLRNPGAFSLGPTLSLTPIAPAVEGTVAVLVDEVSQSQAEYTTMAFRARPGTVVVGSQTAGADGNVSNIPLPAGQRAMISGIGVFYPDGRPTQRIGIVPDVEVHPTIAGLRAGRDEVLEAAVQKVLGRGLTEAERNKLRAEPVALP